MHFPWDAAHHEVVAAITTEFAAVIAALALVRYLTRKRYLYLLVTVTFAGTAAMELLHTIETAGLFHSLFPWRLDELIPWSGWATHLVHAAFLFVLGWQLQRERGEGGARARSPWAPVVVTALVVLGVHSIFGLLPMGLPAYRDGLLGRPQDLLAGTLMLAGMVMALRARPWRPVSFVPWLVTAMGLGAFGELFVMPFSTELYDAPYRVAHVFTLVSYSAVFLGLLYSAHAAFRAESELSDSLRDEQRRLAEIVWSTDVGTWEWDLRSDRVHINERLAVLLGFTREELAGDLLELWRTRCHPEDVADADAALEAHLQRRADHYEAEYRLRHKDGGWVWILDRGKIVQWAEDGLAARMTGTYQDITARKTAEGLAARQRDLLARDVATLQSQRRALSQQAEELTRAADQQRLLAQELQREVDRRSQAERRERHRAQHDPLTDLANRRFLTRLGEDAVDAARIDGSALAVLFVDIDGFKSINDTLGHAAGDLLLLAIAARLRARVRGSDVVARVGGDEFVVLLPRDCSVERAGQLAEAIVRAIGTPFDLRGNEARVGASVGVALFPTHGFTFDALLRSADDAMYAVKTAGKGGWRVAEPVPPPVAAPALDAPG